MDGAFDGFFPVAEVQALVFGVGVGVGVFDADEERGDAAELLGERLDERNRAAATDGDGALAVSFLERAKRRLKSGMGRVGVPPPRTAIGLDVALEPPP